MVEASATILAHPNAIPDIAAIEAEHALWLSSEGKEGRRANLRGLDFSQSDLSGRRLMEASLRGAIFTGANLSGADLRAADLAEANLDNANLRGAQLAGASLARAQLRKANAEGADMVTANFTGAIAEGMVLNDAKLNSAILRDANFRQANFSRVVLKDANLRGANIMGGDVSAADLTSADCRDVNFDGARFAGAQLRGANFRGATLRDVDLQAADFSVAQDVEAEVIQQAVQSERNKLLEEQERTARLQSELDMRAKAIDAQKEELKAQKARLEEFNVTQVAMHARLASFSSGFSVVAVLWLLFAGSIVGLVLNIAAQLQHMQTERAMVIVGVAVVAILLALYSMLRSLQFSGMIKSAAKVFATQFSPESAAPRQEESPQISPAPAKPKKSSRGFGRKK